jgi:hypothetical protein
MKRTATINYNAANTWLEPYIGYTIDIIKTSKYYIWFKWQTFNDGSATHKYKRKCFDINKPIKQL